MPLIVRGPGVKSNSKTDALALSIDLVGVDFLTSYGAYHIPLPQSQSLHSQFHTVGNKLGVESLPSFPVYGSLCILY